MRAVKMPELGTTVDEVKIISWFKKEGDFVKRGEPLFEVETDKASMEVESFVEGYIIKIAASEGDTVASGNEVAYIGEKDEVYQAADKEIKISPMIRKLAEKHGVDISGIKGTGPGGLIIKEDIMGAVDIIEEKKAVNTFSRIEKATARAMVTSKTTIPHVYFSIQVDAGAMQQKRELSGKQISYNAMLLSSLAKCIKQFPYFASRYTEEGRAISPEINIGLAVARGDELIVPVIKHLEAEDISYEKIEDQIQRLVTAVGANKLSQDDVSGAVFTLSNLGAYGIDSFTAVINPPESGILAVGAIKEKAVASGGDITVKSMMELTLSVDHRIINGAYAAGFLQALKTNLERM